ncbi:sphingomyelin synthase, partial [Podila epigama]
NVMANVASYLAPNNTTNPKLTDRLFEAIPSITLLWLTDLADALMFIPTVFLVLTHYRPMYLLSKVLLTWALCNLMRITTVAITSFPDPRAGCQHTVGEFFTTFQLHRCGDCMFSGHTIIFVISALVWTSHGYHRFPRRFRWLAWICMLIVWGLCIGSALIVIANRAHYTVDVMVAFYIAGGNWYILTYLFHRYIEDKGRLRDLTHPWGDGPDPRPHAQERLARRQRRQEERDPEKALGQQDRFEHEVQMQPFETTTTTATTATPNPMIIQQPSNGIFPGYEHVVLQSRPGASSEIYVESGQPSSSGGGGASTTVHYDNEPVLLPGEPHHAP